MQQSTRQVQNQMVNFGTSSQIPSFAQRIAPSVQRIHRDKDDIGKAIEEFWDKCLLSYTKTRDNTIVQKLPLPRVLLHGQTDTVEAEDRHFFMETVKNLFMMPYQAIMKLSWTHSTTP